jgi:flotillin
MRNQISEFMNSPQGWVITGMIILIALLVVWAWVKTLLQVCPPNEVLIFSGRRYRMTDGSFRRYRTIFGGRGWRWPIIERASRMSLNALEVPIMIRGAYSQGGIPLNVDAIANVKISSDPVIVGNAIERFLNRDPNEIRRVAKETLEGHLRGVLARLTPEQVNEDRLRFAEELTNESELDLNKLGIHLDTFKIQHVSDDVHFLDSIGREAIANVIREAEMAESDSKRMAEQVEAENQARATVARANAEANIARMTNDLRRIKAELESEVKSEEERTSAAAKQARATAEQELQQIRAKLEAIRLQVEQVLPAEAEQEAQFLKARGDAAIIRERGQAAAKYLELTTDAWNDAGDAAMQIMVIENLEKILQSASKGVNKVKIDNLRMIDAGDGKTLSGYVAAYPEMLMSMLQAVGRTTGVDVAGVLAGDSKTEVKK